MPKHKGGKKKDNAPKKPQLTHFLCVPLVNPASEPQLKASITRFKHDVCAAAEEGAVKEQPAANTEADLSPSNNTKGGVQLDKQPNEEKPTPPVQAPLIAEKAVRPVAALHLTLGVMSLDGDKLAHATALLETLDLDELLKAATTVKPDAKAGKLGDNTGGQSMENSTEQPSQTPAESTRISTTTPSPYVSLDSPLNISLRSLHPMQSPHKTSILYISPSDPSNRLEPLCSALRSRFAEAELLVPDTRPLKLHATVVNTIYVKGRKKGKGKGRGKGKTEERASEGTEEGKDAGDDNAENGEAASNKEIQEDQVKSQEQASDQIPSQPEPSPQSLTANTPSSGHGPDANTSLRFDARTILERYKDFVWADNFAIDRIAICEMGAKKVLDNKGEVVREEYKEVAVRRLPGC